MLPKMTLPTYEVTLPSTGKKVKIRPFLVKEEKLLLMALESNDNEEIIKTTLQVVQNCLLDKDIDVESLPFFDVDYLFIALRAKSVGESIEVRFTCNNVTEEKTFCGNEFKANIDISNCKIRKDPDITNEIPLGQGVVVKMKYPSYSEMKKINLEKNVTYNIISSCLEMIIQGENVHTRKDFSAEIDEFLGNLTKEQYSKLAEFAESLPSFCVTTEAKCPKCEHNHHIEYDEFESFFV